MMTSVQGGVFVLRHLTAVWKYYFESINVEVNLHVEYIIWNHDTLQYSIPPDLNK